MDRHRPTWTLLELDPADSLSAMIVWRSLDLALEGG
jgi:hypothetical protein